MLSLFTLFSLHLSLARFKYFDDLFQLKCGACGQIGHMRTNKDCPLFAGEKSGPKEKEKPAPIAPVAITEEEEAEMERSNLPDDAELTHVEGTKMKFSKTLLDQ